MPDTSARDRHSHNPLVRYFRILGPGLITGASDDDPSGIATYAVAGAALGLGMLWTAPATLPLMAAVQLICARIGLVTGRGLAGAIRDAGGRVEQQTSARFTFNVVGHPQPCAPAV